MFIRKKKYNELQKQRDTFEGIAGRAVEQNGRILDGWRETLDELNEIQEMNRDLVKYNDVLVARVKDLEAKLALAIKQRDYYYDLLENTSDAFVEGKAISREAE